MRHKRRETRGERQDTSKTLRIKRKETENYESTTSQTMIENTSTSLGVCCYERIEGVREGG